MRIKVKWIIILFVLLAVIALFIWGDHIEPGSIFAGLAAFIATIKARFFGSTGIMRKITGIKTSHESKRNDWEREKKENEKRYDLIKLQIDSLDMRMEFLKEKLQKTPGKDNPPGRRTEAEILEWLNKK